ncbi:MAG TPA: hypothetical protein VL020_04930 [Pseudomonadales bacterium]|nr:hypothetical protein [Pseudomonadales bacterium]
MIGSKVKHDFSNYRGVVKEYRRHPQGYNYKVEFDTGGKSPLTDWFKRKVLVLL